MYELIAKLVYDEMNIYRCIKKSIVVQILSPKQQRWPLPFLLYLSFFYVWGVNEVVIERYDVVKFYTKKINKTAYQGSIIIIWTDAVTIWKLRM